MRIIFLTLLLLFSGCTSYYNPGLSVSEDRAARFKKDRTECRERAAQTANSAPKNELRFLKTYTQEQQESSNEAKAFDRCMSARGWIKK